LGALADPWRCRAKHGCDEPREIFYLNNDPDMSKEKFKKRVDAALARYQRAKEQLRALQPPASLQKKHDEYVTAVLLLEQSATERPQAV